MKKNILIVFIIILIILGIAVAFLVFNKDKSSTTRTSNNQVENIKETEVNKKILIVVYSKTGTSMKIANLLKEKINADIYEIIPETKYAEDMWEAWDEAQEERANNNYPNIVNELPDISKYDIIIIGGPVWGHTLANPTHSYLLKTDFNNKVVSAFWTFVDHDEYYNKDMKSLINNGNYIDGLSLPSRTINNETKLEESINNWLSKLEIYK